MREFWIQIKQHNNEWLHGRLNTNIYTQEHVEITQDKNLEWHKEMCALVREVDLTYDAIVGELVEALELYRGIAGHNCDKSTTKYSAADSVLNKYEAWVTK